MLTLIILGLMVGLPIVLLFLLRSSAAVAFLALCAGLVVLKFTGQDAQLVLASFLPNSSIVVQEALNITLVLLPAIAATVLLRKSMTGPKVILNLIPAAAVGLLTALAIVPLISVVTRDNIMRSQAWSLLEQMEGFIVGAGALVSILMLKSSHKKAASGHKKGHK